MRWPSLLMIVLGPLSARTAAAQERMLSLEDALRLAMPASETLELARAAVERARGEDLRASAGRWPQLSARLSYVRLLRSQFEGFSFGDTTSTDDGTDQLPFGQKNTFGVDLNATWPLFTGGRVSGLTQAADADHRRADLGLTSAEAQVTLQAVQAYYDAVAADYEVGIAQLLVEQADTTLRQTEQRRAAGTQPEFDLLRARVARANSQTELIARQVDRDVAYLNLRRLLGLPPGVAVRLTTSLVDTAVIAQVPTLARILAQPIDTAVERRIVVRQAAEAVSAEEGVAKSIKSDWWPQLTVNSAYGRVGYPSNLDPFAPRYFTNWDLRVGLEFPLFTGGRRLGDRMVADAGIEEARLRLRQTTELAEVDTRSALALLEAAEAAWAASEGNVEQAQRAYEIAELRYREGLSTQLELLDARQARARAESLRLQAARTLGVARVRVALLPALPIVPAGLSVPGTLPAAGATQNMGSLP